MRLLRKLIVRLQSTTAKTRPVAKKVPFTVFAHGHIWQDPYHWMKKQTDDPDFINYLHQENSYSDSFMADTRNLQRTLFSEMKSRMPDTISTPPERWGPWLYYQYIPEGKEYPVLCRRLETLSSTGWLKSVLQSRGKEQVLLDWNQVAEKYGYVHIGTCRVSPDHNFLAYTLDTSGSERFVLQIKDIRNGFIVPRLPVDGVVSLAWAQDSKTLFYTTCDENLRPCRVHYMKLESNDPDDKVVFTEGDSSFCVDITSTKDAKFITVNSNSRTSSEVYLIDAAKPLAGLNRIHKRVSGVQCFVEHHSGLFYILTNAPLSENEMWSTRGDYYLARCRIEDIHTDKWQDIILPSEDTSFQDLDIFNGHLVLFLNRKGVSMLCSISLPIKIDNKFQMEIEHLDPWFFPLPSSSCSILPGSNHDFMKSVYRAVLSSPVMPDVIVDYDMSRKVFSIVQQDEIGNASDIVGSNFSAYYQHTDEFIHQQNHEEENNQNTTSQRWKTISSAYQCDRKDVVSHDGVIIPLTILYSQKNSQKGQSPGLLQVYGAYGEVLDKSWCSDRLSLLDRGWVLAFADVRGGGGVDSEWHKSGTGICKRNSILDFVSCGMYLINEGYICRDRLAAMSSSAGCLVVGAAINMYPQLLRAAILKVPFLDICNTLLDPSLPLTTLDYEEFGNPQIESEFKSIRSYSPYDNIASGVCYPSVLVTASFHDSRVGVWEAAKWVAKVRDKTCSNCSGSIILKTNMCGGHFGEGGRYSQCNETAYEYSFLIKACEGLD